MLVHYVPSGSGKKHFRGPIKIPLHYHNGAPAIRENNAKQKVIPEYRIAPPAKIGSVTLRRGWQNDLSGKLPHGGLDKLLFFRQGKCHRH